jgi:hypothetical protein
VRVRVGTAHLDDELFLPGFAREGLRRLP